MHAYPDETDRAGPANAADSTEAGPQADTEQTLSVYQACREKSRHAAFREGTMGMEAARHELRDLLIAALMTAEECDFLEAQRIVMDFERAIICPRCGAELTDRDENELVGTIWDGWMSRSA